MMVDFVQGQTLMVPMRFDYDDEMISVIVPHGVVSLPADTCVRLDEWARWARPRIGLESHGRCASAEGRYDSRYPGDHGRDHSEVDLHAVLAVERVVCTMLPQAARLIVHRHFVLCYPPQAITRALGIHRACYGRELRRAVLMVKNNLTRAGFPD